jgi:hypothetical protein
VFIFAATNRIQVWHTAVGHLCMRVGGSGLLSFMACGSACMAAAVSCMK